MKKSVVNMRPPDGRMTFWIVLGVLCVAYGGTLTHPMVFDDEVYLRGNPIFREWRSFLDLVRDFGGLARRAGEAALDPDLSTNFIMRPLTYFTFFLNHCWGELSPIGYRLLNILIHGVNGCLVWRLAGRWVEVRGSVDPSDVRRWGWMPFMAAAVFVLHPIQIESVTYIIQRATSLCCGFLLLAVVSHVEWLLSDRLIWRIASCAATVGAVASKETGFVAPVLLLGVEVFIFGSKWREAMRRVWVHGIVVFLVPLALVAVSSAQGKGEGIGSVFGIAHGNQSKSYVAEYAMTQPVVWLHYLRLVVLPVGLNIDPEVQMVLRYTDFRFWGPLAMLGLCALGCMALWGRFRGAGDVSLLVFAAWWWAVSIGPDSSVVPLPDVMAEHRTYVSMVGAALLGGRVIGAIFEYGGWWRVLALGALVLLGGVTVDRNRVWASAERLWADTASKSPGKVRPWINLGSALFEAGKLEAARAAFERANEVNPTVPACANLVVVNLRLGEPERALSAGRRGMDLRPSGYDHLLMLHHATALIRVEREVEALGVIRECVSLQPRFLPARMMYGALLMKRGLFLEAERVFSEGLGWHPEQRELLEGIEQCRSNREPGVRLKLGY